MRNKKMVRYVLAFLYLLVLVFMMPQKFAYVDTSFSTYYLYPYRILPVLITVISALYYLKTLFCKELHLNSVALIITILTYFFTLAYFLTNYVVSDTLNGQDIRVIGYIQFRVGFYLYYFSLLLLLGNFLLTEKYEKKPSRAEKMITHLIDVGNQYFLCYYKRGFVSKFEDLRNNISVVAVKQGSTTLDFCIFSELNIKDKILNESILSIDVHIVDESLPTNINEDEKATVSAFLFKKFGAFIASDKFLNSIEEYGKLKVSKAYQVTITYLENEKKKELVFLAKKNPNAVLDNINCTKSML